MECYVKINNIYIYNVPKGCKDLNDMKIKTGKDYILKKRNDVVVFIRNIMDNVQYRCAFDELSDEIDKTLRVVSKIEADLKNDANKIQLSDIFACDAFKGYPQAV